MMRTLVISAILAIGCSGAGGEPALQNQDLTPGEEIPRDSEDPAPISETGGGTGITPEGGSGGTGGTTDIVNPATGGTGTGGSDVSMPSGGSEPIGSGGTVIEPEPTCAELWPTHEGFRWCCGEPTCEVVEDPATVDWYGYSFPSYCLFMQALDEHPPTAQEIFTAVQKDVTVLEGWPYDSCDEREAENPGWQCENNPAAGNAVRCWAPKQNCTLPEAPGNCF